MAKDKDPKDGKAIKKAKSDRRGQNNQTDDQSLSPGWTDGIPLSPAWWAPVFIALLLIGLLWILVFYLSGTRLPIPNIGKWNLGIGILIMLGGFMMTLKWR